MKNTQLIIFSSLLFFVFSCSQSSDSSKNDLNVCFCDSTYNNTTSDTVSEFLCYKGERVYKLKQWNNRISLSRHSLADNRWLYENLNCDNDYKILPNEYQFFLSTESKNDSVQVTYFLNSIDSMRIIVEHNKDTITSKLYFTNKAMLNKKFFEDSSYFISLCGYTHDSVPDPETKIIGLSIRESSITYPTAYLLDNSLDKVLLKLKKCIDLNRPK